MDVVPCLVIIFALWVEGIDQKTQAKLTAAKPATLSCIQVTGLQITFGLAGQYMYPWLHSRTGLMWWGKVEGRYVLPSTVLLFLQKGHGDGKDGWWSAIWTTGEPRLSVRDFSNRYNIEKET